jgi:hypothetical protein
MAILYVSNLGTDSYTVDGTNDHVQINQALTAASSGDTVYLRGPFTYDLGSWLLIHSNTILTGDSSARLRLKNNAGWSDALVPIINQAETNISNVYIYGFEIDGNASNQSGKSRGDGWYPCLYFTNASNIEMHDMYLHNGLADGMRISLGSNIKYYNNTVSELGHDGCYFLRVNGGEQRGNNTKIRTNSAIVFITVRM